MVIQQFNHAFHCFNKNAIKKQASYSENIPLDTGLIRKINQSIFRAPTSLKKFKSILLANLLVCHCALWTLSALTVQ